MGYSLRVDGWRYTEWAHFDGAIVHGIFLFFHRNNLLSQIHNFVVSGAANGGKGAVDFSKPLYGVELYDHR